MIGFGSWPAEFLEWLAPLVLSTAFVVFYCAVIAIFFVVNAATLGQRVRFIGRQLRRLTNRLNDIDGQQGFVTGFHDYDRSARREFGRAWAEFVETLVMPAPESGKPIHNTGDVAAYLNESTIIAPRVSLAFYQSMPNLLTGFGILGTFIGLSAGVGAASGGLSSGSPTDMTEALTDLLDGASLAFLTSIAGIFLSIVFSLFLRSWTRKLLKALDTWVEAIEERLERVTPAGVALEQLEAERRTAKQVERFNTDLAITLGEALEEKVAGRLSPLLEQLVEAVGELRSDRATDAGQMVEAAINRFTETMEARTGGRFDEMAAVLENLNRTLIGSSEQLERSQEEVGGALEAVVASVRQSMETGAQATAETFRISMAESVEQVRNANREAAEEVQGALGRAARELITAAADASARVSGSSKGLEEAADNLARATRSSRDLLEGTGEFVAQLNGVRETMVTAQRAIVAAADSVGASSEEIRASWDRAASAIRDTAGIVDRIDRVVGELGEQQRAASAAWTSYRERFEGIDVSLARVFQELDRGLAGYCDRVQEFARELDGTTSKTIQSLASATAELEESISELADVMERSTRRR